MSQAESQPYESRSSPTEPPGRATASPPLPRRRWFQFRLRTLMVFMVVVSVLLAGFAWRLQRARRQAEAVAMLRKLDDCVTYESQWSSDHGVPFDPEQQSRVPAFLRNWFGNDFFHDADQVRQIRKRPRSREEVEQFWKAVSYLPNLCSLDVDGAWMDDRGFARLHGSQHVRILHLHSAPVTNDDLRIVGSLAQLEDFYAYHWPPSDDDPIYAIDDRGIAHLHGLTRLKFFSLSHSQISAEGMRRFVEHHPAIESLSLRGESLTDDVAVAIKGLSKLVDLHLLDSKISDQGLASVSQLQKLHSLVIEGTGITDDGLVHLQQMSNLGALGIRKSSVRGSGLEHLRNLPSLGSLWLEHNPLTDDGLKHLEDFPRLAVLDIGDTQITDTGIVDFKLPAGIHLLHLYDTQITDRALEALAKHRQLTMLDVRRTNVTDAGVAAFNGIHPKCDLHR